jgi:hypothetical protein
MSKTLSADKNNRFELLELPPGDATMQIDFAEAAQALDRWSSKLKALGTAYEALQKLKSTMDDASHRKCCDTMIEQLEDAMKASGALVIILQERISEQAGSLLQRHGTAFNDYLASLSRFLQARNDVHGIFATRLMAKKEEEREAACDRILRKYAAEAGIEL